HFFSNESGDQLRQRITEVQYLPKSHIDAWVQQKNRTVQNASRGGQGGFGRGGASGERVMAIRRRVLRALHDGNAKIVFGTDSPQLFNIPGFAIHREMPVMVESGFTPYEVLESATAKAAEYFGTTAEVGTVATGKRADLILLEANPLETVSNVAKRAGVMVRGRWLPESEIQQRLAKYAAASTKN
ncbi:MAG: amidohydrolase family protein, partial [Candidatus Korobacteraceae bacterium]